ncbi:MAG: polysaccharide deacetylase family protein [Chloroflexi bacterium]|nr:polysaccharide deacetylase family protein [Chloroflexota bacterium]
MNSRFSRLMCVGLLIALLAASATTHWYRGAERILESSTHYGATLAIGALILGALAAFVSYYEYHGFGGQEGIVRRGPDAPVVAITFDDGPSPIYTPKILDVLKEKNVRATFFCVGIHVEKYPDVARRIVDEGHDIGNHTYAHRDLLPSTRRIVEEQLRRTDEAIFSVTGVSTRLFRPPRGLYSGAVRRIVVGEFGLRMILWTVSTLDWRRDVTPRQIVKRIAHYLHPGAVILFHDSGALFRREGGKRMTTVKALPMVIDHLREAGYEIVPVSEMLDRLADTAVEPERVLERA